jgi:mannose-6-phosphate isomerase-like protein (cupin superfamily)
MPDYTLYPISAAPRIPFKFDGRILYSSEKFELVYLTLQPGEEMEKHIQPIDVVFFVLEGTGTLDIGHPESLREIIEVAPNMTIHVKAGISRAWRNTGDRQLKILVNKLLS